MSELPSLSMLEKSKQLHQSDQQYYLPTFKRMPVAFHKGDGCMLFDVDGNEYLDCLAGIAVNSLGHNHPSITHAIQKQSQNLLHVSNFFVTPPQVNLSEQLTHATSMDHVFFTNSGTESFEGAIKIARKYAHSIGRGGTIVSMNGAFHGRTMAAIAAGKPKMQNGFAPIPQGFATIPFNDINAAIQKIKSKDVAAIILEPIQGEGGIHSADRDYLHQLRQSCTKNQVVLIFDEIQCGMGRTGHLLASQMYDVQPDITLLAKALGNGVPIGAILSSKKISNAIDFGDHGTTFGGNPLACATALSTLNEINSTDFLHSVREKGAYLKSKLTTLAEEHDCIKDIRGHGLMIGVEFNFPTLPLALKMLDHRIVVNATSENVLRLVPPLIITTSQIDRLCHHLHLAILELKSKNQ